MNEPKTFLENVDVLDAKKILSRDFDQFDIDRLISSVDKVKIQVDNAITNANNEVYTFRSFISDGTYFRPESARIRIGMTIKDAGVALVAGDKTVFENSPAFLQKAELYLNNQKVETLDNIVHTFAHKLRKNYTRDWLNSFGTITMGGFPDETNENFASDPLGFHYTTSVLAFGSLESKAVDASNDADTGWLVPLANDLTTGKQYRKGGAGYISATNKGSMTRAKLALNPLFFEIPLSMLFDTIKNMSYAFQHINSLRVVLTRVADIYDFCTSTKATAITTTIDSIELLHDNVKLNPEGELYLQKMRNSPSYIPFVQYLSLVEAGPADGIRTSTWQRDLGGLKSSHHYFLSQTTADPNKNKAHSNSLYAHQSFTKKVVILDGKTLDDGTIVCATNLNRLQSYSDWLSTTDMDEKVSGNSIMGYNEHCYLWPGVHQNLQPEKYTTKNGALYSLDPKIKHINEQVYWTPATCTSVIHIYECESLLRLDDKSASVLINSGAS